MKMQRTIVLFIKFYPTLRSNYQFRTFYNFLFNLTQKAICEILSSLCISNRLHPVAFSYFNLSPLPEKSGPIITKLGRYVT